MRTYFYHTSPRQREQLLCLCSLPVLTLSLFFFALLHVSLLGEIALADTNTILSGEIAAELEEENPDNYEATKSSIIDKLRVLEQVMETPFNPLKPPPRFSDEELLMLASLHLHCTLQEGVCTLIPFTLFEADLIQSARDEKASCPNLLIFWKQWLSADMEKRVDMNLGVVHYEKRSEYKAAMRPKLLRCSKTIALMLENQKEVKSYFEKRYGKKKALPQKLELYITELHKKLPNIYQATGVR